MGPEIFASLIAAVASGVGALIAAQAKRLLAYHPGEIQIAFEATANPVTDSRLPEVRNALSRQESIAKWNGRANTSLTFGQYVVGGVLASSFVQESLTPQVVGFLGVLVLVSSLVHQRYRPDLQASGARQRVMKLRALIREIEDDLFALRDGYEDAPSVYEIRQKASAGLSDVEESELLESNKEAAEATAA